MNLQHPCRHPSRPVAIVVLACFLVGAVTASAAGQSEQSTTDQHQAVVRIVNTQAGSRSYGSGTLLDKDDRHGVVLTCAHLFRQGVGAVSVEFAGGHSYGARVLKLDETWDLAALLIYAPRAEATSLASDPPTPGDELNSCGYGRDGRFWCNHGKALQYVTAGGTASAETLEISGMARQGDSGGPILNARGELAAVVLATNGRVVIGTACGRIRRFLAGISPRFSRPVPPRTPDKVSPPPKVEQDRFPALIARLDKMQAGVQMLESNVKKMHENFETRGTSLAKKIERLSSLAGALSARVGKAESSVSESRLRGLLGEVVMRLGAERQLALAGLLWPVAGGALGLSAPPVVAVFAWKLLCAAHRRRRRERVRRRRRPDDKDDTGRRPAHARAQPEASLNLNDDYGRQLMEVFAQSGRSPVQDATLGREYDEEIRAAEQSSDLMLARWARRMRDKVERKFHRVHGRSPAPAEPMAEADTLAATDNINREGKTNDLG